MTSSPKYIQQVHLPPTSFPWTRSPPILPGDSISLINRSYDLILNCFWQCSSWHHKLDNLNFIKSSSGGPDLALVPLAPSPFPRGGPPASLFGPRSNCDRGGCGTFGASSLWATWLLDKQCPRAKFVVSRSKSSMAYSHLRCLRACAESWCCCLTFEANFTFSCCFRRFHYLHCPYCRVHGYFNGCAV